MNAQPMPVRIGRKAYRIHFAADGGVSRIAYSSATTPGNLDMTGRTAYGVLSEALRVLTRQRAATIAAGNEPTSIDAVRTAIQAAAIRNMTKDTKQ